MLIQFEVNRWFWLLIKIIDMYKFENEYVIIISVEFIILH